MKQKLYYLMRPFIPRQIQILLRRIDIQIKLSEAKKIWPIDETSGEQPQNWKGWPNGKKIALVISHDVDTQKGQERCEDLMRVEQDMGFHSVFNFVPERYPLREDLINLINSNGFEVGVHGLKHDGKLFRTKKIFEKRAERIKHYLNRWQAVGFNSPSMHHKLDWLHQLNILYDRSTFDTDPFEPQSDGVRTIFPFWIKGKSDNEGYIELPYTLPQDFTLFVLMKEKNIGIWKRKLDWIVEKGGMAYLNTHPDYMNFGHMKKKIDDYPVKYYIEFLEYIKKNYKDQYWHVLPRELATYWKNSYR